MDLLMKLAEAQDAERNAIRRGDTGTAQLWRRQQRLLETLIERRKIRGES